VSDRHRSPLHDAHVALGAKLVEFGGWEMPLAYPSGAVAEHRACRSGAACFDVSHLGTVAVEGSEAHDTLQRALTNDLGRIGPGRTQYSLLLDDDGSVTDDVVVWWVSEDRFQVMPNASNTRRVRSIIGGADVTAGRAVLALQGPRARARLAPVFPDGAQVGRHEVQALSWQGAPCTVAGTGYTGEDGVECAIDAAAAPQLWQALMEAGFEPAGLGARDTLRLEAGLPLYGHELGPGITPLQARLGWVVAWGKGTFRGRPALEQERRDGPGRLLWGVATSNRRPPRAGDAVLAGGAPIGALTSGNFSPMLGIGIGLALLDAGTVRASGDPVEIDIRGRREAARLTRPPFWPPTEGAG